MTSVPCQYQVQRGDNGGGTRHTHAAYLQSPASFIDYRMLHAQPSDACGSPSPRLVSACSLQVQHNVTNRTAPSLQRLSSADDPTVTLTLAGPGSIEHLKDLERVQQEASPTPRPVEELGASADISGVAVAGTFPEALVTPPRLGHPAPEAANSGVRPRF